MGIFLSNERCGRSYWYPRGRAAILGGFRLVEVIFKMMSRLLNRWLTSEITSHDVLHGFWVVCGTGTATLKSKMLQQLMALR